MDTTSYISCERDARTRATHPTGATLVVQAGAIADRGQLFVWLPVGMNTPKRSGGMT